MRKGKGIVSLLLAVAILLSVITAAGTAAAEGLLAKEYTHELYGILYAPGNWTAFQIIESTYSIANKIPALYQLIIRDDTGELSPDYKYDWQLSNEALAANLNFTKDDEYADLSGSFEQLEKAHALVGKTVYTLIISRKSDGATVTEVNCVLKEMYYTPEWENYDYKRQEIIFTPGKPVTITLPEDRIASTYDGAKLIYEWERSLGDSYYTLESGVGLTSITFTPEADWDGNWVYVYVNRENIPEEEMASLNIDYMLKSDGIVPIPPDEPVTPGGSGTTTNVPKTGDETPLATLGTLLLLSLLGVGALLLYRRRSA